MLARSGRARPWVALDTIERHAVGAQLLQAPETVLDVGGVPGGLAPFLPGTRVVVANVEAPADVLVEGLLLPFPDRSFDAVVSLDVLEHLRTDDRGRHLRELARVARRRVVLCCPLWSAPHELAERRLCDWYERTTGRQHRFLAEHVECGLPREDELRALAAEAGLDCELFFHGDFRRVDASFRLGVAARRDPRALLHFLRHRLATRTHLELDRAPSEWTNRVFLAGSPRET